MSKISLNPTAGSRFFRNQLLRPENLPFTFVYDGVSHRGFEGLDTRSRRTSTENGVQITHRAMLDDALELSCVCFHNDEFGENEYTVYFRNIGKNTSKVLSSVVCADLDFPGRHPLLRSNMGDHDNWYARYEQDLTLADKYFLSTTGRATHIVFPYFDLVHGNGGTMIALGWAGTWEGLFSTHDEVTHFQAKTCIGLNACLLPGESVRTGLVVLLDYKGRDYDNASNLWREWFMKYNLPKADAAGNPLLPFSTVGFMGDTGLPNSDGSISERSFTWKPTLDKLEKENMLADFRWFDAGWYFDPKGQTVESDWWGTVGTWELDRVKWPDQTFLESNEACHRLGMKVLTWFEPERVTDVENLAENYGYNPAWGIGPGNVKTNNLGDPDCLAWTLDRITKMLGEHGVDMYREDNNSDPGFAWPFLDDQESRQYGIPRSGVNENKCICGHYALWDGIIRFCGEHGKCTFVDSCASGGGRNDIESMRRGFPLMRSDYDRTSSSMRLSQSSTFCRWIPFHGSSTKETVGQLDNPSGKGSTPYVNRASLLPIYNFSGAFTHNEELDYDMMRRNFNEWKSVRHLLTKDMYFLTPWHHEYSRSSWTAFAYDDPELGESLLLAFRMEEAKAETFLAKLPFADPDARYELRDADTGRVETNVSGKVLREGIPVTLTEPKSSALIRICRL